MTPDAQAMQSLSMTSPSTSRVALLRLQLKPEVPTDAALDGAWWPRSLDLAVELPALISSLSERLGQAALVVYDEDAWDDLPPALKGDRQAVRLEGAVSESPDRITIVGRAGQRLTLLVVPPDATNPEALDSMTAASSTPNESGGGLDQASARTLDEVAGHLARHEGAKDAHRTAQITRWVMETAEGFADAPIKSFVPILVEHIVRARIDATAGAR